MVMPTDGIKISQLPSLAAPTPTDQIPIVSAGVTDRATPASLLTDWKGLSVLPNSITYLGKRLYQLIFPSVDYTGILSPEMRLMTKRNVSSSTQSTILSGTQWWNNTAPNKLVFTNLFTIIGWVKPTAYTGGNQTIIARRGTTTSVAGWQMGLDSSGRLFVQAFNGASGAVGKTATTYQTVPINKTSFCAASVDMAGTISLYVDGDLMPSITSNIGTGSTSLIQAGDLTVGAFTGGNEPFTGLISYTGVFSSVLSAATILSLFSQGLTGSEPTLLSAYSFNGVATDLMTTTPNNLTAQGSAGYTAGSPFGNQASGIISPTLDFGVIKSIIFSTNSTMTVQVPEGCTIPTSGGLSAISYSTVAIPYNFPFSKIDLTVANNSFSRAEVNTGTTWIDGRPIYKTTFVQSVTGSGSEQAFNLNIAPSVSMVVKAEGGVLVGTDLFPFQYVNAAAPTAQNAQAKIRISGGVWQVALFAGANGTIYLTLYYVK